jgi:hypothetical protein
MGVLSQNTEGKSMSATTAKRRLLNLLSGLLLGAMLPLAAVAQAPTSSEQPTGVPSPEIESTDRAGCVLDHHTYTCNFGAFHHMFHRSKTIAIEASPRDHAALSQLTELVAALNRTVAPDGQGELVFTVLPLDHGGVIIGPGDVDMATLRVYEQGSDGAHGELLWVETYRGQSDRPWPATVYALIRQFHDRMVKWRK